MRQVTTAARCIAAETAGWQTTAIERASSGLVHCPRSADALERFCRRHCSPIAECPLRTRSSVGCVVGVELANGENVSSRLRLQQDVGRRRSSMPLQWSSAISPVGDFPARPRSGRHSFAGSAGVWSLPRPGVSDPGMTAMRGSRAARHLGPGIGPP